MRPLTWLCVLLAGCDGAITSGRPPSAIDPGEEARTKTNPTLEELAQKYFPGEAAGAPPKRLFRLTQTQLDLTARALLPSHAVGSISATMPRDPLQTNYEYAANLGFGPATFTPYTEWAAALASSSAPSAVTGSCAPTSTTCLRSAARDFVQRAFRGSANDVQLDRYAALFIARAADAGVAAAAADLVDVTVGAPAFAFRDEVSTDASGTLLAPQALAALTYTLADVPPEALGLNGSVSPPDAVDRVLASEAARAKLQRFFFAWLELREADEFTIAPSAFPEFTPALAAAARAETAGFIASALAKPTPSLKDVTQGTPQVSPALTALYGAQTGPEHRLGVLTQVATIASHSGPTTTRLVKRGVFFTRKALCMSLGAPPPDVVTTLPTEGGDTERARIENATTPARCQGCHAYINPFGFALENYDAIGRWRTTDDGHPIDPRVTVPWLDEGELTADSPVAALKAFTSSARFKQCFVKQLFRYYVGRDELPSDAPLLRDMFFWFAHDDAQDLTKLLRTLGSSPRLYERSEAP
ncbi:MAG: DUF1588 domain-containing protein [Myxococcaceae bacterium]|nr:DUF1588 domain-containing protein [Myxococcaceae bacterium]